MDLHAFPRIPLAHLPTAFEAMPRLSESLGGPRLWVKRDDATGLAFGGNKTRKLEFSLGAARAEGADVVVTMGGVQSNHVRQTAAAAARAGFDCELILGPSPFDQLAHRESGNRLLDELLGARVHEAADDALEERAAARCEELREQGRRPFLIPIGASDGTGALGIVQCGLELAEQWREAALEPAGVVLATGSAGTHAGLLMGLRAAGRDTPVLGFSVSEPAAVKRHKVRRVLDELRQKLGETAPAPPDDEIVVDDAQVGAGYGVPTAAAAEAIHLAARQEGLLLDPVYTGKAFAGLIERTRAGAWSRDQDLVFLHTGGAPALFAYPDLIRSAPAGTSMPAP